MESSSPSAFPRITVAAIGLVAWAAFAPAVPASEIPVCREAGFWQTHGGSEKGAPNIVQDLIAQAGDCIDVCGELLQSTAVDDADSALEGLCVSSKSKPSIQLARQAIAAALSCVISSGDPDCLEGSSFCNDACADGVQDERDTLCQAYLSCTVSGGWLDLVSLGCWLGTCSIDATPCGTGGAASCPAGQTCVPYSDSCALAPLVNDELGLDFDPLPAASSSKACNAASKSACTFVGPKEANCEDGSNGEGPETCPTTTTTTTTTTSTSTSTTTLLARSCEGYCGQNDTAPPGSGPNCYCDLLSCSMGDGCFDRDVQCPDLCSATTTTTTLPPPRSCEGYCGQHDVAPPGSGGFCYCDADSCYYGDGCADRDIWCPDVCTPPTTMMPQP